ncbi:MAG: DUF188 domain-containing protein [Oscillospiraceae bacterium]|nr:DUF188 domain-containing protein [Oscillospiraceae bacterium]
MQIYIDADGCPVVDEAIALCKAFSLPCTILCDTAHQIERDGARTLVCSKGADSVDFTLVNLIASGDVVVTQDYGLAAMCLARGTFPIHQDGYFYTNENIDALLLARHTSAKVRRAGGRFKTTPKRTKEQSQAFCNALKSFLETKTTRLE